MKTTITVSVLALLLPLSLVRAGGPALGGGTALCAPDGADKAVCDLRWGLSAMPRALYIVEWLNPETGEWEAAIGRPYTSPYHSARGMPAGRLYRVLGCDDVGRKGNCVSTTAFWAPVMLKASKMPASVAIRTRDGEVQNAQVSKAARVYTQIMQLNVSMLADVLGRAATADLPPMSAPPEPGTPGDMAHDVHHNVYAVYEETRKLRSRGPAVMDAEF